MRHIRLLRNSSGFTYLWVLLMVAVLELGVLLAVEIDSTATRRDKERELLAIGHQFRIAIARYHEANFPGKKHEYPASLEDLLKDNRDPNIRRYLRRIYIDPMTGGKDWGLVLVSGKIVGVYSLSEQIPIKQDGFDWEDSAFKGKDKYSEWIFTYPPDILIHKNVGS